MHVQVINGVGDLLDLMNVVNPKNAPKWFEMSEEEFSRTLYDRSLCSALVKITPTFDELFAGHSAWFTYSGTQPLLCPSLLMLARCRRVDANRPLCVMCATRRTQR